MSEVGSYLTERLSKFILCLGPLLYAKSRCFVPQFRHSEGTCKHRPAKSFGSLRPEGREPSTL
jgi:hypothetical protein